eukprot:gene23306-4029_t
MGTTASVLTVVVVVVFSVLVAPVTSNSACVGHSLFNVESFPSAFAAITLSFGGHACFPSLEAGMASPATFPKVLNYAYGGMLTMYLLVAVFGYY